MAENADPLWDELERLAEASIADSQIANQYPSPETVERWQRLFGYSSVEAARLITAQRQDSMHMHRIKQTLPDESLPLTPFPVTRQRITDEHWALIKDAEEAAGYDREAYEHLQRLSDLFESTGMMLPVKGQEGRVVFGFRMGGLLDTVEKIKDVGMMEELPKIEDGWSESGPVKFCLVDMDTKKRLKEWLTQQAVLKG
ncbi:hypothetical protein BU23DRAFT_565249 [Bimuria novae-zelandiae CBS 107.79]|uniref:Uncharacterized protein n=1 Tax=Bimuria novae-zelandiae CBS 107.79 TaxID=1447943 RepID=A0A6A5VIN9_9PLEO|nr:hypothetical protein BU23DRAFT_565249 [Bimuria novae-zelandiae CBS 107.79]